jgi:hypothetical protein
VQARGASAAAAARPTAARCLAPLQVCLHVQGVQQLLSERVSWTVTEEEPEYHSSSRRQQHAPLPSLVLDSVVCPEQGPVVITAYGSLVS